TPVIVSSGERPVQRPARKSQASRCPCEGSRGRAQEGPPEIVFQVVALPPAPRLQVSPEEQKRIDLAIDRGLAALRRMQLPTGSWHDGQNLIKPLKAGVPTRRSVSVMKPSCSLSPCSGCPDRIVCRCFGVKESTIVQAIATLGLRTVKEIRK